MIDALGSQVIAILAREEGRRLACYDDATGLPIRPGSHVIGHPTIGVGRALDVCGITAAEADALLMGDVAGLLDKLPKLIPGWAGLSVPRQAVLVCMGFQLGVNGLLGFHTMLGAVARGDWPAVAVSMRTSRWGSQTPARVERMAILMLHG